MITIYTTNSCSSCRKAIQWLKDHNIKYTEKNIFSSKITRDDLKLILKNSENGFDDIISTRSKYFIEHHLNLDDMKFSEVENLILENPSLLRRPIIIDDNKFQVGYNDEDIRVFIPRELRKMFTCESCKKCDYEIELTNQIKSQ